MSVRHVIPGMKGGTRRWVSASIGMALLGAAGLALVLGKVDISLSDSDRLYVGRLASDYGFSALPAERTFEQEVDHILAVQRAVLDRLHIDEGVPHGVERTSEALYHGRRGLCYDRSWFIERVLKTSGFRTRHIFVYQADGPWGALELARPGIPTHAMTEVKTMKGWLVVGSNSAWVSLDGRGNPLSAAALSKDKAIEVSAWDSRIKGHIPDILKRTHKFIYGVYSRHGGFYRPFVPVPDFSPWEILQNFGG